jgi:N-acetylneuraminic acid mutarotase
MNSTGYTFFYNAASDTWTQRANMNVSRYGHTAAWVDGRACVVGGIHVDDESQLVLQSSAECYNAINNNWIEIAPAEIPRFGAGSAVGPDGRWYVFGGITGNNETVSEVEVYDPATNCGVRWGRRPI